MKRATFIVLLSLSVFSFGSVTTLGQENSKGVAAAETSELLVFLTPGTDAKAFAAERGMVIKRALRSDPDAYVMVAGSVAKARTMLGALRAAGKAAGTRAVYTNVKRQYVLDAFVPNDPYFHKNTPSGTWPGQWHLINEHVAGRDARVQGAWNRNLTGSGVLIGICDDGLQRTHPDLSPNYVAADSWDFFGDDSDPSPVQTADNHGTSVAGVAAARGGNSIGVTGAAPHAGLAGLRLPFHVMDQDMALFVDAILYHSSGANTSIKIKNHSYGTTPYRPSEAEADAQETSTAAGTIHCWAAGNGGNSNIKDNQAHPDAIVVSALGSDGRYADYSSYGANVIVTAPSSSYMLFGITTTDRTTEADGYNGSTDNFPDSNYHSDFGGTSSASPLVAGVMALAKQAQPLLNTRFAKHLLARTSDIVDATDATPESDGGWRTNAAGFQFNQRYGFGLIDADELTQMAVQYAGVTPLTTQSTGTVAVNQTLADTGSRTVQFALTATQPLEEVVVTIDFETTNAYPLEVNLTAPSGYRTRLVEGTTLMPGTAHTRMAWRYVANALWGESPAGTWTLELEDTKSDGLQVIWHSFEVTARMGTLSYGNCISAPTGVSATDGTQVYTRVTWTGVSGATHYRVYRATSNDFVSAQAISNWQTAASFDDSTGLPLTAYYYWVRAASDSLGQCSSPPSNSDVGWCKLRPPTNVAASDGATVAGVQVTWDAAPPATHYRVYRSSVANDPLATPISSWQTGLSFLDSTSGAAPGVIMHYRVSSATGSSGQDASSFSPSDPGFRKLAAPTNAQASQGTYDDRVRITWMSVPGATHYRVFRNTVDNPMEAMGVGPWATTTSCDDTTADPCVTYYYWVQAAMSSTGSRTSDLSTAATGWRTMSAPTNVSASDGTSTDYCRVSWSPASGATHYRVWRSTDSNVASAINIGTWRTETFYDDTSATHGRVYYYWVVAATSSSGACASPKSTSFDSGWKGLLPPNCINATDGESAERVYVGWCYSDYDIYHKVYRGPTSDSAAAVAITGWIDSSYYEDATGNPGEQYYYFVKSAMAADGTGESGFSPGDLGWRTFAVPSGVAASDGTSTVHVRVTWNLGEAGLWYQVFRGASNDTRSATAISTWRQDAASYDDTTALVSTTYYYWVKAATDSTGSNTSDFGGPDTGWKAMVGPDVSASNRTYVNRVAVSWTGPISGYYYRVHRATSNNSSLAQPLSAWQTSRSYSDFTAEPGVSYYYWVKISINSAGDYPSAFGRGARGVRALDCNNNNIPDQNDPDTDGDGVPDDCDLCPNTPQGTAVDANGCPVIILVPAVTSFVINDGASVTSSRTVTLNNVCTNTPTEYLASEASDFAGASWLSYSTASTFELSAGSGTKTVYFKVRNADGESAVVSDTITLLACNTPLMDANGDLHVDATDFDAFSACYNGPTNLVTGDCLCLDSNSDQYVDATDFDAFSACYNGPTNPPGCGTPGGPACNTPRIDTNGDLHVDATDFDAFSACYNGPTNLVTGDCLCLDSNSDQYVDATDFDAFSACYNGPTNPPRCES